MSGTTAAFELIEQMEKDRTSGLTVKEMCELAGVSRSGYYAWKNALDKRRERELKDKADFDLILSVYNQRGYSKGVKAIHMGLLHLDPPVVMNIKKIRRIMRKYKLMCPIRKPNPYKQLARHLAENAVAPNLLQREFESYGPRAVLLTDITYLPYAEGQNAYLSTVLDAYTKEILAWVVSDSLEVEFVIETMRQLDRNYGSELSDAAVIHSDQGCHYTSHAFQGILADLDLIQSMSRRGCCWDNSPMESFFGRLKDHIRDDIASCTSVSEIRETVRDYIDYYNNDRYQWDLAKLSPREFYEFCTTGEYPLQIAKPPAVPVAEQNPEELRRRAAAAAQRKSQTAENTAATKDATSHDRQHAQV